MSVPLFSIIMPCLNEVAHISEALESVLAQDYGDWELIVADGGSTDGTPETLNSYEPRFGGRMTWYREHDAGIYDAMNRALDRAAGEYVGFLGADDRLRPGALTAVANALVRAPRSDIVCGATHVFGPNAEWDEPARVKIRRGLAQRAPAGHQSTFVRRQAIKAIGGFDQRFRIAADYDLYLRLVEAGGTERLLEEALSEFRLGGASSRSAWATARDYRDVRIAHKANPIVENLVMVKSALAATAFAIWMRLFHRVPGETRPSGSNR